jgi:hypothetical protein
VCERWCDDDDDDDGINDDDGYRLKDVDFR